MPFSDQVHQKLQTLYDLNPEEHSVSLEGDHLVMTPKWGIFYRIVRWLVWQISLHLIPRNPELGQIAREVLNDLYANLGLINCANQGFIKTAVSHLKDTLANNGGCEEVEAAVGLMLETIAKKIEKSPTVLNLKSKSCRQEPTAKAIESEPAHLKDELYAHLISAGEARLAAKAIEKDENALHNLLQDIFKVDFRTGLKRLFQLLYTLEGFAPLTGPEMLMLAGGLSYAEKHYGCDQFSVFSKLFPRVIECLVRDSLRQGHLICFNLMLVAMARKLLDVEQVRAFAKGFDIELWAKEKPALAPDQFHDLFYLLMEPANVAVLQEQLSDTDFKQFVKALVQLANSHHGGESKALYEVVQKFGAEYQALGF